MRDAAGVEATLSESVHRDWRQRLPTLASLPSQPPIRIDEAGQTCQVIAALATAIDPQRSL